MEEKDILVETKIPVSSVQYIKLMVGSLAKLWKPMQDSTSKGEGNSHSAPSPLSISLADTMGDYRAMLIELAGTITDDYLKKMLFQLKDVIKKRESEKIRTAIDLWNALEDRGWLGANNLETVKLLLRTCMEGKIDGLKIVDYYEAIRDQRPPLQFIVELPLAKPQPQIVYVNNPIQPVSDPAQRTQNGQQKYYGQDLSNEINFLTRNLGRNWRFFMRALGVDDTIIEHVEGQYRSVRDQIYYCMQEWIQDQKQGATKEKIIYALRDSSVERNDLAADLAEGKYK